MPKSNLNLNNLRTTAADFSRTISLKNHPKLYGVTDGKAVGTYIEHEFQKLLSNTYNYTRGSSAIGIDLPSINTDIKVTSIKQPQSSCPYQSARQKVYGLGYHLILFVYEKTDNNNSCNLNIGHAVFIDKSKTADFALTSLLNKTIECGGNEDDIISDLHSKHLPLDEIGAASLAKDILNNPPEIGYLTISNALQWRLQYQRVIGIAGTIPGVFKL